MICLDYKKSTLELNNFSKCIKNNLGFIMKKILLCISLLCTMSCIMKAMQPGQKKSNNQPHKIYHVSVANSAAELRAYLESEDQALLERIRAASAKVKLKSKL